MIDTLQAFDKISVYVDIILHYHKCVGVYQMYIAHQLRHFIFGYDGSNDGSVGAVEQIVFDPADNLLLFSRQYGLMAYTLQNNARNTITEAPSSQKFTINNLPTGSSPSTVKIPGINELGAKRITLYDWTTKTKIGSFTPYDNVADQSYLSHSINVRKVITGKELETDFFTYAPGEGGMKSIARAIVIDNPVINLQVEHYCHKMSDEVSVDEGHRKVRLTWEAQTYDRDNFNNYEIRYGWCDSVFRSY